MNETLNADHIERGSICVCPVLIVFCHWIDSWLCDLPTPVPYCTFEEWQNETFFCVSELMDRCFTFVGLTSP